MSRLKPLGNGPITRLLSWIYLFFVTCRNYLYDSFPFVIKKIGSYTISVGGIHAGGTGKTPLAGLIGEFFIQQEYDTVFLSRGYGRKSSKRIIVKPGENIDWNEIGDEPAMLHRNLSDSWLGIGADRYRNAKEIKAKIGKKSVFILDDGFQRRKIFRDKNILCLPSRPFNDYMIPSGTLREPFSSIKRADIVCIIGSLNEREILEKQKKYLNERYNNPEVYILYQSVEKWVNTKTGDNLQIPPVKSPLVVCGIARPYRFLDFIKGVGITPYKSICYNDHHIYKSDEIDLFRSSQIDGILTTEKDAIRLSTINLVYFKNIWYLKLKLLFENGMCQKNFFHCLLR